MVLARLALDAARIKFLDSVVGRLWGSYKGLGEREEEHAREMDDYRLDGQKYFGSGPLKDVAGREGLEDHLEEYKQSALKMVRQYVAELGKLVDYLRQSIQDPAQSSPLNDYLMLRRSDEILSTLIGYKRAEPIRKGYLSDVINAYFEKIDDLNKRFNRILYVASGFDEQGSGFVRSAARFVAKNIAYGVIAKRGLPAGTIDTVVSSLANPFVGIKKKAQPLLAEYSELVDKWKNVYAADLADGVYETEPVAA